VEKGIAEEVGMERVPPSIFPVVVLTGSNYEMGYQYGAQVGHLIWEEVTAARATAVRYLGSEALLRNLVGQYRNGLRRFQGEAEMMEGIAAGASQRGRRLRYEDILMLNTCTASFTMLQDISRAAGERGEAGGCTVFSAWGPATHDGELICGDSSDSRFSRQVVILGFPREGHRFMCIARAGQLSHHFAMNDQGLFIGNSGGDSVRPTDYCCGVPWTLAISRLVRLAGSAQEAAAELGKWTVNMPENYHLADTQGTALVVEVTASRRGTRLSGDFGESSYLYSTNNFFTQEMRECFDFPEAVPRAGWRGRPSLASVPRNLFLSELLNNGHGAIDIEYAKMMWRCPGKAPPDPFNVDAYYSGGWSEWQQVICNLNNDHVAVVKPRSGSGGVAYICAGPAAPIAYPFTPDKHWYLPDPLNAFVKLVLCDDVTSFLEQCELDAHQSLGEAYAGFMELTPNATAYAYLRERMSQATAAFFEGTQSAAEISRQLRHGGTAVAARAATLFARTQAYAAHISDVLSPPPRSPEELR